MHFEILVEDESGKRMVEILAKKIVGDNHSVRVKSYKGLGRIPRNMGNDIKAIPNRLLLEQLPKVLNGYGRTFKNQPDQYAVIVVCDLDDKCLKTFRKELISVLDACREKPVTRFCIAVEEGEAWLLGDMDAIRTVFPRADNAVLNRYTNDSICNTWELLADAIHHGGTAALKKQGWQATGEAKSRWAEKISVNIDVDRNLSPSFQYFRRKLRELIGES